MTAEEKETVLAALYRRAVGYTATEENSEYTLSAEGVWEAVKRKVSSREVPPELSAIKTLLETAPEEKELSEEELLKERERLLGILEEKTKNKK